MPSAKEKILILDEAFAAIAYLKQLTEGLWTQNQVAWSLGVSRSTLAAWFAGRTVPRQQQIEKLKLFFSQYKNKKFYELELSPLNSENAASCDFESGNSINLKGENNKQES